MEELVLVFPTMEYQNQVLEYKQEFIRAEEVFINGSGGLSKFEKYDEWLKKVQEDQRSPVKRVPTTEYLAIRKEDNKMIGMIQIRHRLNKLLYEYSGHIGYSVRPTERKKGYATKMLQLALKKCKDEGLKEILITCDVSNLASESVIRKNGGRFEKEEMYNGERIKRYWILLN